MSKKTLFKAIYVEWKDACASSGWKEINTADVDPILIKSIGWLVKETKEYLTITHGHDTEPPHLINGFMTIPKAWIQKRKYIKI